MSNFLSWIVKNKAALVGFAAAIGALLHATMPAVASATGVWAGDAMLVGAVIMAILTAYNSATTGGNDG